MLSRVTDELKPPVAIRITRPYATEAEFLEREFDTLTHTSVVLLGAQARPQGVVLRFEIVLKNGESILRGEGRVVGFKDKAYAGEPGLSLRFTRLDSRSKTLVDRASALREARVRASTSLMSMPAVVVPRPAPAPPLAPTAPPPAIESAPRLPAPPARISTPPPPPSRRTPPPLPGWAKLASHSVSSAASASREIEIPIDVESTQVDAHFDIPPPLPREPEFAAPEVAAPEVAVAAVAVSPSPPVRQPIRPTPSRPPPALPRTVPARVPAAAPKPAVPTEPAAQPTPPTQARARPDRSDHDPSLGALGRPADRDALLTRLRARAESLPMIRVQEILARGSR
jgi:hypothetical protein